ncbi:MAG: RidA family protein [Rhodothermales bacterium]
MPRPTSWYVAAAFALAGCVPPAEPPAETAGRRVIATEQAPPAIGPYSQAIQVGNQLFLAGQIGLDPQTRALVEGGVGPQTHRVMQNQRAVLEAAGFSLADVVQVQIFLADLAEYGAVNEIYGSYFPSAPPARATVQVARLPLDARVEIMMTAAK